MARGTSLLELVGDLRVELGRASNISVGPGDLPMLKRVLARTQKVLWTQHEWPFLRTMFERITLQAGDRMYDMPANLDIDRIESVAVWQNDIPVPTKRGIGWNEYAAYKPGDRMDPVMRWDVRVDESTFQTQMEVWPTPASDTYAMQIIGIRKLRPLVHDTDLCDLDDELILLFAASQLLARQKSGDAQLVLSQAQEHLLKCKAKANTGEYKSVRVGLGRGGSDTPSRTQVYVAGYPVNVKTGP